MNMSNIPVDYQAVHKDPTDTELAAYKKVTKSQLRRDVLFHIFMQRHTPSVGATGSELANLIGKSILSVRPRLTELEAYGYIQKSDKRRPNASNCSEIVFCISALGIVSMNKILEEEKNDQ